METVGHVEKQVRFFHMSLQNACWRFAQFPQAQPPSLTNNKTGHFTCYKNRTFSFATDIDFLPTNL